MSKKKLRLWLISQDTVTGCDIYDSAVVAAENEEDARATHPGGKFSIPMSAEDASKYSNDTWVNEPALVTTKLIGVAEHDVERGVICASFNAG